MSGAVSAITAVAAVASAYSANKQASAQKSAQRDAEKRANEQKTQAERDFNRTNQKKPDLGKIMEANAQRGEAGSTMLTGPSGVSSDSLSLGKNTLLG